MCTALVVREDYWRDYFWREAEIRGIKITRYQFERAITWCYDFAERVGEAIRKIIDAFTEAMSYVAIALRDSFGSLIEALRNSFDKLDIEPFDDFDVVCDKIEARAIYLNRKESIRREQYYRNCFKLAKMNYNIQHHDRRC